MSAEILREAAALMRERAEAAGIPSGAGDWFVGSPTDDNQFATVCSSGGQVARGMADDEAEHIASWSPPVALAVADWLDGVALFVEAKDDEEYFDLDGDPIAPEDTHAIGSALAVARAYLSGHPNV